MLKETQIEFGGKPYTVKKSYRSLLEFEDRTGRGIVEIKQSLKDLMMLFYCIIISNNKVEFSYNEFVDMVDQNDGTMDKFNKFLLESSVEQPEEPAKKKRQSK